MLQFQPLKKTTAFCANQPLCASQKGKNFWEKLQFSISSTFRILGFHPLLETTAGLPKGALPKGSLPKGALLKGFPAKRRTAKRRTAKRHSAKRLQ